MDERTKEDDSGIQVKGQVNKLPIESDPMGINCEGGITTNEDGDPPASELELLERRTTPVELENLLLGEDGDQRRADSNPSNRMDRSMLAKSADQTVGESTGSDPAPEGSSPSGGTGPDKGPKTNETGTATKPGK